ncbi:MAG: ferritin-like protein [Candidatus Thiodiazotropha taylori]|nr:ferritin-like protein [Candidatus Thiodiazotropha taylori]
MLKVDRNLIDEIMTAAHLLSTQNDTQNAILQLRKTLHMAMRLEASTIPPYLVAAWSIQDSPNFQNEEIRDLITDIAKEEMLHMMGIANIIAATGEPPKIATPEIVLDWGVSRLPVGGDLVPRLAPFSESLLTDLLMEIEKPEDPIHYVVVEAFQPQKAGLVEGRYATIGEFYKALLDLINTFQYDPFEEGQSHPQIKMSFDRRIGEIDHDPITDFQVTDKDQAKAIINWIIGQGEGTPSDPMTGNGIPAHYYRFAEIYKRGKLTRDVFAPLGYVYDRAQHPIECDFSKIQQFRPNPKMRDFDPSSSHYRGLKIFNEAYTRVFHKIQVFYSDNNQQQEIPYSINSMNNMVNYVEPLFSLDPPICPSFEWIEDVSH